MTRQALTAHDLARRTCPGQVYTGRFESKPIKVMKQKIHRPLETFVFRDQVQETLG